MAMNKTTLATAIVDAMVPLNGELTGAARTQAIAVWEKACEQIISHIINNAVITVTSLPGTGTVTSGPGVGGAVTVTSSGATEARVTA